MKLNRPSQILSAIPVFLLVPALNASAFYNAKEGRWLSRDPLEEASFRSLNKPELAVMDTGFSVGLVSYPAFGKNYTAR